MTQPSNRRSHRRILPLLGLVLVAWACTKSTTRQIGDAMVDAAEALKDAGSTLVDAGSEDASAQTPSLTVTDVTCTLTAENVIVNTTTTIRTTYSYAWVDVADPRKVLVERCGMSESASCSAGSTCTVGIPVPSCRITTPMFENGKVFVECGRTIQTTNNSTSAVLSESSQSSTSARLLISP